MSPLRAAPVLTALALLSLAPPRPATGQEAPPRRQFALEARDEPVRAVIARIQGETGRPCRVSRELADLRLTFSISISTVTDPQSALLNYVAQKLREQRNGIVLTQEPDGFALLAAGVTEHPREPLRPQPPDPRLGGPQAQGFTATPLRAAFRRYFAGSAARLEIAPGVPDVPITFRHAAVPAQEGLLLLLAEAQTYVPELMLERGRGVYHLTAERRPPPAAAFVERLRGLRVTFDLREANFRVALAQVFRGTGLRYEMAPTIPLHARVTLSVKDLPLDQALARLAAALGRTVPRASVSYSGTLIRFERRAAPPAPAP